jgi:hypothetical protein
MSKKRFRPQWSFIKSVPGLEAPEGGPVVLVEDGQRLPQEVLVPAALLAVQDNWPYDHQLVVHLLTVEKSSYIKKSCLKLLVCLHYLYYFLKIIILYPCGIRSHNIKYIQLLQSPRW